MTLTFHHAGKWLGALTLVAMITIGLFVKYELLPIPVVQTEEVGGQDVQGDFYPHVVSNDAIVELNGHRYIYLVKPPSAYWLDGHYAYKVEVEVLARDERVAAIAMANLPFEIQELNKVVLHPPASFGKEQKIRLKTGAAVS